MESGGRHGSKAKTVSAAGIRSLTILFASPNTPLHAAGMQAQTKYVSGADSLQRTHPDTPQFTAGLGSFAFAAEKLFADAGKRGKL